MKTLERQSMSRQLGFTLTELLVAMVVASILIALALPMYSNQVRESRRTEGKNAVMDLASREERLFSTTNNYSNSPAALGYSGAAFPLSVGSGFYTVNVTNTAALPPAPAQFSVTATPVGGQAQDTVCAALTVDYTGKQSATNSGGADSSTTCWK